MGGPDPAPAGRRGCAAAGGAAQSAVVKAVLRRTLPSCKALLVWGWVLLLGGSAAADTDTDTGAYPAESGGRYLVIACSEPKSAKGSAAAHGKVRRLRAARFDRAYVVDGGELPKVGDYWICLVDSFADLKPASELAARARGAGFKDAYVAPGW